MSGNNKKEEQCCATVESLALRKAMQKQRGQMNVYSERYYFRCPNKGKVCRDGKWYCGVHDPLAVRERHKKQDERKRERQSAHAGSGAKLGEAQQNVQGMADFYRKEIDRLQKMVSWLANELAELHGTSYMLVDGAPEGSHLCPYWIDRAEKETADTTVSQRFSADRPNVSNGPRSAVRDGQDTVWEKVPSEEKSRLLELAQLVTPGPYFADGYDVQDNSDRCAARCNGGLNNLQEDTQESFTHFIATACNLAPRLVRELEAAETTSEELVAERDWLVEKLADISDKMNRAGAPPFCAACNICPVSDNEMEGRTCAVAIAEAAHQAAQENK